jgi:hypothetical protein
MRTIYKYKLTLNKTTIELPVRSKVLTAAAQGDDVCIWVEVTTGQVPTEPRIFEVFLTGHPIPERGGERHYIATAFMDWMVFHVYERKNLSF